MRASSKFIVGRLAASLMSCNSFFPTKCEERVTTSLTMRVLVKMNLREIIDFHTNSIEVSGTKSNRYASSF